MRKWTRKQAKNGNQQLNKKDAAADRLEDKENQARGDEAVGNPGI